ncbi:MAG: DNA polymerase III subunit gamma and tau, partial [Propionicimonas sp.]|nr:DNA polymerase III subunit gamma and tau [Propionicimonas sp.]
MDERDDDLFEEEPLELYEQEGPSLFEEPGEPEAFDVAEPPSGTLSGRSQDEVTASLMNAVDALREPNETIDRPDAPLALYRRYRPDTFAEVIGQEHVTEPLQRALLNNKVNHAYLFSGPRGCGKTTSARILARCLNCAKGPTPVPCGECQSCRDLARGGPGSIDVIEIDAASHGGVDDARDLRERAFFAPVHSRYKIYIIDEAHMVTPQGFNAMLKVVEEPPPHVKFIFATTEPEKVIGTIRSRTHHYPFRLVPPKVLSGYLGEVCASEGIAVEPAVLPLVVRAGAGSVRDSLSVLDQLLGGAGEDGVSYPQATALLGYTPDALLDEIVDAFAAGDSHGVFAAIDKVIEVGQDPRRFAEDLLRRLRDLIIVAAVPDALSSGLVDVAADQAERLSSQANALGAGELTRAAEVIAVGLTEMRGTTAPRLHLELMCARVLLPGADVDGRGLHARLDRLERLVQQGVPVPPPAEDAS